MKRPPLFATLVVLLAVTSAIVIRDMATLAHLAALG